MATKAMVLRHAEKPVGIPLTLGVSESGQEDEKELVVRGWQRAGALACLFSPKMVTARYPELATPQAIFAASSVHNKSLRPEHTVAPLGAVLNLNPDTSFAQGDEKELVAAVQATQGIVLIAWHHEAIPKIGNLIFGNDTSCPQKWHDDRFDIIWVFDHLLAGGGWRFSQVPQLLLAGDSPVAIN